MRLRRGYLSEHSTSTENAWKDIHTLFCKDQPGWPVHAMREDKGSGGWVEGKRWKYKTNYLQFLQSRMKTELFVGPINMVQSSQSSTLTADMWSNRYLRLFVVVCQELSREGKKEKKRTKQTNTKNDENKNKSIKTHTLQFFRRSKVNIWPSIDPGIFPNVCPSKSLNT